MHAAIFWIDVVLLTVLAGDALGAEAETASRSSASTAFLLNPARVFDTANGQIHTGWSVLVTSNQIAAAGPAAQVEAPTNAVVIPLADMTLLPGLMDIHSHIFLHPYNETSWDDQVLKEPVAYRSVQAVLHVKNTLLAGFTLLRDLGTEGAGFSDLSIKRAIAEGLIPGPRLRGSRAFKRRLDG